MNHPHLPAPLAAALFVGLLASTPSAASAAYSFWPHCHGVLDRHLEPLGLTALCDRYVFVVEEHAAARRRLHAVAREAAPVDLGRDGLLVFVDVEGPTPALYAAGYAGLLPEDAGVLALLQWAEPDRTLFPRPILERRADDVVAEVIADAGLYVLARELGMAWAEDDGVALFSSVEVINLRTLGLLTMAARLSEAGREFFRALRRDRIGMPLDALLAWRLTTRFDDAVAVTSTGRLPCVRALELDLGALETAVLERLALDPEGTFQLTRCVGEE